MKLANVVLKLDKIGTSVPLKKVTPSEVMFLVADHHPNAGGDPILKLEELDEEVDITPSQERRRLAEKYGARRVSKFYPGPIPTLPQTFEEARGAGISSSAPTERLLTVGDVQ